MGVREFNGSTGVAEQIDEQSMTLEMIISRPREICKMLVEVARAPRGTRRLNYTPRLKHRERNKHPILKRLTMLQRSIPRLSLGRTELSHLFLPSIRHNSTSRTVRKAEADRPINEVSEEPVEPQIATGKPPNTPEAAEELARTRKALASLITGDHRWAVIKDGFALSRKFTFKNFSHSRCFVTEILLMQSRLNHHARVVINHHTVDVTLRSHRPKGLTMKDCLLAEDCYNWARRFHAVNLSSAKSPVRHALEADGEADGEATYVDAEDVVGPFDAEDVAASEGAAGKSAS